MCRPITFHIKLSSLRSSLCSVQRKTALDACSATLYVPYLFNRESQLLNRFLYSTALGMCVHIFLIFRKSDNVFAFRQGNGRSTRLKQFTNADISSSKKIKIYVFLSRLVYFLQMLNSNISHISFAVTECSNVADTS